MATKLRSLTRKTSTKVVAFLLAMLMSAGIVGSAGALAATIIDNGLNEKFLVDKDAWINSAVDDLTWRGHTLYQFMYSPGEDAIKAGDTLDEEQIFSDIFEAFLDGQSFENEGDGALTDKQINSDKFKTAIENQIRSYEDYDDSTDVEGILADVKAWMSDNRTCYESIKNTQINQQLEDYRSLANDVSQFEADDEYYVYGETFGGDDTQLVSNADAKAVEGSQLYVVYTPSTGKFELKGALMEDTAFANKANTAAEDLSALAISKALDSKAEDDKDRLMIGLSGENVYLRTDYDSAYNTLWMYIAEIVICSVVLILCMVLLCMGAGWEKDEETVKLHGFDKIWTEAQLVWVVMLLGMGIAAALALAELALYQTVNGSNDIRPWLMYAAIPAIAAGTAALCLPCLLSQARRVKTRSFLNGFIITKGVKWLAQTWRRGPIFIKVIMLAIAWPIIVPIVWMNPPFALLVICAALFFGVRYATHLNEICRGAKRIRSGNTAEKIELKHAGRELNELADDLNSISEGVNNSVQAQLKSERLKTELISNVSHDLKTPLTGIMTYVDLMKQLEPGDPKMQEYLKVVDQKSKRLSALINDILEASKASSGAMKTDLMRVDWEALFTQAYGELEDKLRAAGLEVKLTVKGRTDVKADGRQLWRVMENLLSNCARYAVPNSRVYAELCEQGGWCIFTLKNISAQELNISADELMERFTRGDRARYTEGSGLGLSIAKSLSELMGGRLELVVDGDLFKAIVYMPLWREE